MDIDDEEGLTPVPTLQRQSSREEVFFTTDEYDDAVELAIKDPLGAADKLKKLVQKQESGEEMHNKTLRMKEEAIYKICAIYAKANDAAKVKQVMVDIRPFFKQIAKSRAAKIVRHLIEEIGKVPNTTQLQMELCEDAVEWCLKEKASFLRQRIQAKLAALYCELKRYKDALALTKKLLREVKKFDDKALMVEIELVESQVFYILKNIPKSKGALTAARANANAFYCPPLLQARIDLQAGILCGAEKDFKTAFSYFYEAYEGYNNANMGLTAMVCLKYMCLAKIMTSQPADVYSIINGKAGIKYAGVELEAMRAVSDAYKNRSIQTLEEVLARYKPQLADDLIIAGHLAELRDNLLDQNLLRLLEPFSRVQLAHVAKLIALPRAVVEAKLSEMILDKKLLGILDQGSGDLILFEPSAEDVSYKHSLAAVKELDACVDRLYAKTKRLAQS